MTRFFMTIPEAAQLIVQAGAMGEGGEVFVLDMGEPVKIIDLARNMIELSGLRPGIDIEIKIVGLRDGEKLHEELFSGDETPDRTSHGKIFRSAVELRARGRRVPRRARGVRTGRVRRRPARDARAADADHAAAHRGRRAPRRRRARAACLT